MAFLVQPHFSICLASVLARHFAITAMVIMFDLQLHFPNHFWCDYTFLFVHFLSQHWGNAASITDGTINKAFLYFQMLEGYNDYDMCLSFVLEFFQSNAKQSHTSKLEFYHVKLYINYSFIVNCFANNPRITICFNNMLRIFVI